MAQLGWTYLGDYDAIMGYYDGQHFSVEDGNRVYKYTSDGGSTFQNLGLTLNFTEQLISIEYLSTNQLRAIVFSSSNFDLYESTNGGQSFSLLSTVLPSQMPPLNQAPQMVSFNQNEALLQCKVLYQSQLIPVLFRTIDGGLNWNLALTDTFAFKDLHHMAIYKDGHIIAASNLPQGIEISTDKGQSFSATASFPPLNSSMEVAFDGNQNLWATGIAGSQNARAYSSSDGGQNWNAWTAVPKGDKLLFANPSELLIYGSDDTTAFSDDSGASFNTVKFPADKPLGSLARLGLGGDQQSYFFNDGAANLWVFNPNGGVGLEDQAYANELAVYPNPANDKLYFSPSALQFKPTKVSILNLDGTQLAVYDFLPYSNSISLATIPSGSYVLLLENESGARFYARIIKR